jgi:hypothetical protein
MSNARRYYSAESENMRKGNYKVKLAAGRSVNMFYDTSANSMSSHANFSLKGLYILPKVSTTVDKLATAHLICILSKNLNPEM